MSWLQAHVLTDPVHAPGVEAALAAAGAGSVTLLDAEDQPVLEPLPGETPLWPHVRVTGLFDDASGAAALQANIRTALGPGLGDAIRIEPLADQVWERTWLDHFHPMRFGRRLWVVPGGQTAELGAGDIAVELDPGLAFGTGTHPTTALCLEWLDGLELAGRRVIDVGCGSGILAIAALRLGAAHALAIDHDPQALLATRENAARNGVAERLTVLGTDAPPAPAEVVIANILAGTLIELAPRIAAMVAPGGRLALSGILADQADGVLTAYRSLGESRPQGRSYTDPHPASGRSASSGAAGSRPQGRSCEDPNLAAGRSASLGAIGNAAEGTAAGPIRFAEPVLRDGWALVHGIRGAA
jgi:ribosomal protein L11 methyltransferase